MFFLLNGRRKDYIGSMMQEQTNTKHNYLPPAIFFAVSIIFVLPFLLKWKYIGVGDWELFVTMAAVPVKTVLHFHQFPFWNPYIGGGNILFAHPEVGILSPFFLLLLIFGPIGGLKLQMLLCYFLGFYGTYKLAGRLGLSSMASYLVSFAFFGSSYFALHFSIGHVPFTHFCFLPWFIFFLLKVQDNTKYLFGAAVSIALIVIGNGAAIPFLYTLFFSGVFVLIYSIEQKSFRFIKAYIISIIVGLLLASVKFIPMIVYLSRNQWEGMPHDFTPLALAMKGLFSFNQRLFHQAIPNQYWGFHEYGAFISPLVIILALAGMIFSFRKSRLWLIVALFFFLFGLGDLFNFSPWNLFLHLPGFSSIRSPARAFQFVVLPIAIIAGFGLDVIYEKIKTAENTKRIFAGIIVVAVLLINYFVDLPAIKTIEYKLPRQVVFHNEFRQELGGEDEIYRLFRENRGSLKAPWLSAYKESRGIVTPTNEVLMEYILKGRLQVVSRQYTPNKVEYEIAPQSAGTIVFGIGYDPGWYATDGRTIYEANRLVTTDFTVSDSKIVLKYRPPYFILGLIISILSILGCLFLGFNGKAAKWLEPIFK
jgi:hypothetical protein